MKKEEFNKLVETGQVQGKCRYDEYWFVYQNVPDFGNVLDVGVGQSALPQILKLKGLNSYAADIDSRYINYQGEHGIICYEVDSQGRIPVPTNSMDIVVAVSSIEHFDDDIKTVEEIHRILKTDGLFIITIPIGPKFIDNLYADKPKHPRERVYDQGDYEQVFLNGFKEEKRDFLEPEKGWDSLNGLMAVLRKI